jgi:NADH-quinone oxidoreductase subunit N
MVIGISTMFIGSILATKQTRIRKFIACNSVSIIGFFFIAFSMNDTTIFIYSSLLVYSYITGLIGFFSIIMLTTNTTTTSTITHLEEFKNISISNSLFGKILVGILFIISGLPFFFLFFYKSEFASNLIILNYSLESIFVLVVGIISCFNYVQIIKQIIYTDGTLEKSNYFIRISISDFIYIVLLQLFSLLIMFLIL